MKNSVKLKIHIQLFNGINEDLKTLPYYNFSANS